MSPPPTPWRSSASVFTFAWLSKKPHSWSQGKDIVGRVWGGWELENPGRNETNWWEEVTKKKEKTERKTAGSFQHQPDDSNSSSTISVSIVLHWLPRAQYPTPCFPPPQFTPFLCQVASLCQHTQQKLFTEKLLAGPDLRSSYR